MSTCVNLNLKEFKDCCKRLNVSPTTLEPIVHEYINIGGNENSFPSDAYISERIHGREVSVLSDAQIKVWERKFSEPKTFNSNEEAVAYYNEARKYFPKEAIGFKETRDGKYEVRVAQPFIADEIKQIKQKAIADGTFMKAPNGKPTNLTEDQWLSVRTKAFKRWFGDWENDPKNASKVVDENGEPLVVYHESPNNFRTFDPDKKRYDVHKEKAFWFSKVDRKGEGYGKYIYPVFLNIKKPNISSWEDKKQVGLNGLRALEDTLLRDESSDGLITDTYDKFGREVQYAVKHSNQIKSAEFNIGYSEKDNNIYKHLLHKNIISEEDYIEFITEFELNRDKTDNFLYNFVTKILQVNPRNKRDKSIALTVQNYPTPNKIFTNWRTRDILIKNILGLYSPVDFDSETFEEELKDYIENKWEKDLYDELVRLDKEKLVRLGSLYKEKTTLKHNISLLQSYLRSKDNSSKEVLEYIESFKWNKKETTSITQHIAYELKKKKAELESLEEKIKHYRFSNAAKTLKVKNRLAAIYNIENAKELIFNRIKADRDSYKVSKEEWEEKVAPYIPLYEKAVKASKNAELLDYNNPVFENKKSLDEITVDEIYDNLIKFNPELKPLLDFIRTVNPKLKIKVYNTEDYENLAERKSDYISGESASIYFPKKNEIGFRLNADTPTILHELLHSVSSYGLIGSSKDQKALGKNVIQPFIDYIDNYLKRNVGNFGAATIWGVKMPAHVYGLTNPAEFIAELFSNKDFQELLDSIPPMEKKQYNSLLEEIIDSILEFVKSIFSPKTNETALDQAKQLALAVIRTQQEHMEEIYEQLANMEDTVQKQILGKGELTSSSAKATREQRKTYTGMISSLEDNQIFVFGSNTEGRHGAGAAKAAKDNFGAKYGQAEGLQGQSYAIITKDLTKDDKKNPSRTPEQIKEQIHKLYEYARQHPDKEFLVAYSSTGKNLNYYSNDAMAEMFASESIPSNIVFEEGFNSLVSKYESSNEFAETQESLSSKEEFEERAKEIQESLGVTEEEAEELAELFDTDNTEEELKQKQQSEEEEDKVRKHILSIDSQIKELTGSNVISRSEITELAYDIVYTVSDFLTQWQNDPKLVIEKFNKDKKDIEKIKTMSRKELANYIGINNIFDFIKEAYFGEIKPTDSNEIIEKKEVIYDNFEAILQFGKSAFNTIEDFSIGYSEVGYNTKDKSENDNESELTNEEQTAKEELGDKQEHWQIDSRTIDNFLSMSQTVKRELLNLYELEEVVKDGISVIQPKLNAFGMKKRVSPKDATSSILRWTRGALTLKQMIVKLQEKEDKHPWVKELITKLSDDNKTGKYTDFQSQFFNVFCKHFQDYYAVTKETNKDGTTITKVIPLNLNPALKGAVDAIKILYQVRRHPLFDKSGKVDIALNTLKKYKELLEKITDKPFEEIDLDRVKTGIFKISQLLGFSTTEEEISKVLSTNNIKTFIKNLDNIVDNLEKGAKLQNYSPFDFKGTNSISGYVREFIRPITERREDTAISSLYDSGKMYQSYVIPSWLSKTMDKFMNLEGEEYERFLMEEYGQYDWFRDTSVEDVTDTTAWRCPWLKRLANASLEERRKIFGHHVQLNYLGHNYMKNMSGPEYTLSVINEFFTDTTDSKESIGTAWYKIPMMSNKPSAEFIKFIRYKGLTYKNDITNELVNVYIQELMRIQTVIQRGYTKNDPEFIKAFDNRGKHFLFLDYLDDYLNGDKKDQELGKLLNAKVLGKKLPDVTITVKGETKIISGEQRLLDLVKNEIRTQMDAKVVSIIESYKANGIFEAAKNVQGVSKTDEELTRDLENFIWNDTFASINILQITITDLAYYKDTEDVQKRLAQIHAPGMRPNVEATDYEGNRVCPDGMFRTAFLKDFEGKAVFELDEIIQNVIDNIEVVFQRKIDVAKSNNNKIEEEYWTSTMNFIIEQLKETVNVADAQAFNCPTSYRKKALMFGKWDKKYEEVYQKLKNKEYNINDLEAAFQPLKPFVYTSTSKDSGVTNTPIKNMKVGMQFKNSEYLLIMADAILRGEDTGKPNLLRAIFDVMEESAKKHPGKGIDSIMFGSAVKAGLHGQIDIADSMTEEEAKARLEVIFDSNSKDGMYNPTFVHTYPAEDYTIQQEVPAHFMDHDQAHGTQERMIIPSDLPSVDENGNEVFFEYYDYKEGKVVKKNAKEFRKAYEENIAESINQNLEELEDVLGLNIVGPDARRQRNIKLSKILQEEILSSPRYGIDLYVACSVNEKGEFNIPLGDPVQSKRVEQLINSVIKNRLNKQKIAGGPVVQVSNFGMSKRLSIKFKKEDGTILPTFKEWQAENENGTIEDYKEMLKKEQAGIAHYECYAPAYMKEMFECFMNEKGELDVEAMEESNPEMLEMVGYRIPSEDAYSVAPLKIVGFLPKEAGEGIVMPYEITLITGSDFDIDKFYLMRKEFNIKLNKIKDIKDALKANNSTISDKEINKFIKLAINPKTRQDAYNKYPNLAKDFRRIAFLVDKPTKGRRARNNQVVDMSLAVLRHKTSTARILNPGGFEAQKRMGYLVTAYKLGKGDWEYLNSLSTDDLKKLCYTDKNLTYIDTNAQFYNQNNVAGAILGMFAVQKTAHATLENNGYHLNVSQTLGLGEGQIFSFAGYSLIGMMELDATTNSKGEYIGKVLGSLVASAADAVKDPVLNLMNINSTTAPVLTAMIRLGIPFETASLLLSQDVITEVLNQFAIENISNYKSFTEILNDKIEDLKKTIVAKEGDDLSTEEITEEELIKGLTPNAADNIKYKSLIALKKFITLSQQIKGITYTTRLNSLSGAVGPLVIDNIIMNDKLQNFGDCIYKEEITDDESKWVRQTSEDVLNEHSILRGFSKGLDVAQEIFEDFIPIVSRDFNTVLSKLSPDTKQKLFADRKLFSKFVDFYNSYLLAASGCVNTSAEHTKYLIEKFPQQVIDSKIKERYPNNKFIQALKFDNETIPGGTRLVIKVETTGMDTTDKEVLSSGWADLHKDNPKLSKLLFEYCFVKGGIGFTPKTFMHLLPVEVKMQMKDYINTFKNKPSTNANLVIDQFVRNNSKNNKLAPKIEPNKTDAKYNTDTKELILSGSNYDMVSDLTYCKIKLKDGKYHLFFITKDKRIATLVEVSVLGNNGEYLELSTKNISKEGNNTVIENTDDAATFIPEASNQDGDNNALIIEGLSQDEISYYSELLASAFESPNSVPNFRKRSDKDKAALKKNYETFFTNKFKELGIEYNQSEFDKLYKVFCG